MPLANLPGLRNGEEDENDDPQSDNHRRGSHEPRGSSIQNPNNQQSKRTRRTKSGPPSTITVPVEEKNLLRQLSDCCEKHTKQCHNRKSNDDEVDDYDETVCQAALEIVRGALPKVEAAYVYQPNNNNKRSRRGGGPEAHEVGVLCIFYKDALLGGYCPLAPGLFQTPEGFPHVHEVLLRVQFLYQQCTSPKWIAETVSPQEDHHNHLACQRPPYPIWNVEKTIGYFLNFLVTSSANIWPPQTRAMYRHAIECDLIQTMMDLAILAEYLEDPNNCVKDNNTTESQSTTAEETPQQQQSIQILLFLKTSALDHNMRQQQQHDNNRTEPTPPHHEYVLDIPPTRDAIWSLQTATLNIFVRLCTLIQEADVNDELLPPRQWKLPLEDLFASLRPILVSTCVSVLAERARSAALEFVMTRGSLVWLPEMELGHVLELALLVVHAMGAVFLRQEQWRHYAPAKQPPQVPTLCSDVLHKLVWLLRRTVLFPPRIRGYCQTEATGILRREVLMPLLEECLPWIRQAASSSSSSLDHQNTPQRQEENAMHSTTDALEEMVLRTIHVCMYTTQQQSMVIANSNLVVATAGPLLDLLIKTRSAHISSICMAILSAFLKPDHQAKRLCAAVWAQQQQENGQSTFWISRVPPSPTRPYSQEILSMVKPKEQEEEVAPQRTPVKEGVSPAGKGSSKSKRRASLLGNNPLIIQSPMPKRQKLEDEESGVTAAICKVDSSCFLDDLLGQFLSQGLDAAEFILGELGDKTQGLSRDFWDKALVFVGCMKVLQAVTTQEGNAASFANDENWRDADSCVTCFVECWQSLCTLFYENAKSESHTNGYSANWESLASMMIDCGLYSFQVSATINSPSQVLGSPFREGCDKLCAALAIMARRVGPASLQKRSPQDEQVCQGCCRDVLGAFSLNETLTSRLFGSDACLCALSVGRIESQQARMMPFRRDCDVVTVAALPISARCCMLASLLIQPQAQPRNKTATLAPTWESMQKVVSAFRIALAAKTFEWNNMTCAALISVPLQIVISCLGQAEFVQSSWHVSHVGFILTDFMRSVMLPAIQTIQNVENNNLQVSASKALFVALKQLQWLHLLLEERCDGSKKDLREAESRDWDVSSSLQFLFRSYTANFPRSTSNGENPSSGAYDGLRRELVVRLSRYVVADPENSKDISEILEDLGSTLRLLRWKCVAWECLRLRCTVHLKEIKWLMLIPFCDSDEQIREYSARELGKVLLANHGYALFALYADEDDEWDAPVDTRMLDHSAEPSGEESHPSEDDEIEVRIHRQTHSLDRIVQALFHEIDQLMTFYCDRTYTPTPTQTSSQEDSASKREDQDQDRRVRRVSAIRVLSSLCYFADANSYVGMKVLEQAFSRLTRLASAFDDDSKQPRDAFLRKFATASSSFRELMQLSRHRRKFLDHFTGSLVRDVLMPHSSLAARYDCDSDLADISPGTRERRYFRLSRLLCGFLGASNKGVLTCKRLDSVDSFLREAVPHVLTHLVQCRDYDSLRLFAGFYPYFLRSMNQLQDKARRRRANEPLLANREVTLGESKFKKFAGPVISALVLKEKTHSLCLHPENVGRMLTAVLMKSDKNSLTFLRCTVLDGKDEWTLRKVIEAAENEIVKALAANLGSDPQNVTPAIVAVKTAAIAMLHEPTGSAREDAASLADKLASQWITKHFMVIIVMVIQHKWKSKSHKDKLRSMRSLKILLRFLLPNEALHYFPQVLAVTSAAIEDGSSSGFDDEAKLLVCGRMRLLAVEVLAKFCQLLGPPAWPQIGQNLTTITVSLMPALSQPDSTVHAEVQRLQQLSSAAAASLLEWLSVGARGNFFKQYFREIPFLPASSQLDVVRSNLKERGVVFDNLASTEEGSAQQHASSRDSYTGSAEASISSTVGKGSKLARENERAQQTALSKRLKTVCELLGNENVSIRKAILKHLLGLLRANRSLFHSLVANEGSISNRHFLTLQFSGKEESAESFSVTTMMGILLARSVNETDDDAKSLLGTCLGEVGAIGEHRLGGISMAAVMGPSDSLEACDNDWRLSQPPWASNTSRYELQLVKRHLVAALKATTSTEDQNKVAFAFQELLHLLDDAAHQGSSQRPDTSLGDAGDKPRREMSSWLSGQLQDAGVFETVEPYWNTNFTESQKQMLAAVEPPFFKTSNTYYLWLSQWCRFMALRSHSGKSPWSSMFHGCRTALRAPAGLVVAEFLLPLLVLDRLCFGSLQESTIILQEIRDVFGYSKNHFADDSTGTDMTNRMSQPEHRKAVNTIFMVIDNWQHWVEFYKENRQQHKPSKRSSHSPDLSPIEAWTADDCIFRIEEILSKIPLLLQAEAAASVGMHARALRLLEMAARSSVVKKVFNATGSDRVEANSPKVKQGSSRALGSHVVSGVDLNLMKEVLSELSDYETMAALEVDSRHAKPWERTMDSIRQNEASGNWEGALRDYERFQQLRDESKDSTLQGALRCLLKLGQFESVLNQVRGIVHGGDTSSHASSRAMLAEPFAVEAAWRLGRWQTLSEVSNQICQRGNIATTLGPDATYQIAQGQAMLALHEKKADAVVSALTTGRQAVMDSLSSVARESYSRAYPYVVRLQCLREIEDAAEFMCSSDDSSPFSFVELTKSESHYGWSWQKRLELVSSSSSAAVIDTRLALARLAKDPVLEGSLFLTVGKKARKSGLLGIAADALAAAETTFHCVPSTAAREVDGLLNTTKMQLAKLKHSAGQNGAALKMLGQDQVNHLYVMNAVDAKNAVLSQEREAEGSMRAPVEDDVVIVRFSSRVLLSTQWIVEGGLKDGAEIMNRFETIHKLAHKMEKGNFYFAKYVDSIVSNRIAAMMSSPQAQNQARVDEDIVRSEAIKKDSWCQQYMLKAMEHYTLSLRLSLKHVYHALPRLLSLWFELSSVLASEKVGSTTQSGNKKQRVSYGSSKRRSSQNTKSTGENQDHRANKFMLENVKLVSTKTFYTAMPQLIAQIMHKDSRTAEIVQALLKEVLARYPEQAMWPLAWLCHSTNSNRNRIGQDIFKAAEKALDKNNKNSLRNLLVASKSLFRHLQSIAKFEVQDPKGKRRGSISLNPWRGEVPLCDFVPPVQAALTAVLPSSDGIGRKKDLFPRQVPRMRDFSSEVKVMSSKARPKRITAYVIPAASASMIRREKQKIAKKPLEIDIGELHFLVKQEVKGDLRKDARVQDLNTVINRLMASSRDSGKCGFSSQNRQLRLRTFAVLCLSEESGILEWVPDTTALRALIQGTYNPQACEHSARRRGSNAVNFADAHLRQAFDKCQSAFFEGKPTDAAALFEERMLKEYPPLFYWWFVQKFQDPHAWYEARTAFTLSAAIWSGVGHVLGLGDRHTENILVDTNTGECVHVDFDCIFDKALNLPRPEIVPFRLTANMLDAFGPTGADGVYSASLKLTMGTLRDNRDTLLSVLEPFIKDPVIDWKRAKSTQSPKKKSSSTGGRLDMTQVADRQTRDAKQSIKVVEQRLRGIYNLRNPNWKKIKRKDGFAAGNQQQPDELTQLLPLSVEGQVHQLITEATSSENLVQLYVGWMPWV
ncbi:protein kinase ATR [Seminavis robusta]|uniref:non-specific serine/threonine protein kinase n=1 Tax=Seminavis robusta TaxID=568900 RepID=A0A9N8H5Y1_9STRA|nr:protein kinase ATR [Seminavis robusta]|eukprot:Sro98_g050510.1 protein kinase ATR (3539) ;mRNA; f:64712-76100